MRAFIALLLAESCLKCLALHTVSVDQALTGTCWTLLAPLTSVRGRGVTLAFAAYAVAVTVANFLVIGKGGFYYRNEFGIHRVLYNGTF